MIELNEKLISIVNNVLDELYNNEQYLFDNNLSERDMVFHFGWYFRRKVESMQEFDGYSVEVDWNKDEADIKMLEIDGEKRRIFPDFILHKRGNNDNNLLAIEFKKNKFIDKKDFYKLEKLTDSNYLYRYKLGLFIKFAIRRDLVRVTYFVDGKLVDINS